MEDKIPQRWGRRAATPGRRGAPSLPGELKNLDFIIYHLSFIILFYSSVLTSVS